MKNENFLNAQITTQAVIKNNSNNILLLRRNKLNGWYTLPGGTVHQGEKVSDALVREILEETGLKITVGKPLWIWQSNHIGKDLLGIVFAIQETIANSTIIKLSAEHDQSKWLKFNDLMTDNSVDPYIKKDLLNY